MKINEERLWSRLNTVGAIGADPRDGVSRFPWEPAYKQAVDLLISWIEDAGLTARIDTVGNVFARLEGDDPAQPAVLSGSHFDTVPCGGFFDGLAGVMAALEALTVIKETNAAHKRPIEMVAFINEEGSTFLGGTFGSKAMCGMLPADCADTLRHRQTDKLLREAMLESGLGLDPDNFAASIISPADYYAFIELHIEQGRHLLDSGLPVSVVTDIAGIKQFFIVIEGVAAHAGGMAMQQRHDAMAAAAAIACEVERLALNSGSSTRGTVGYIEAQPGEHNIIARRCVVPVDMREAKDEILEKCYADLLTFAEHECKKRGLTWSTYYTLDAAPAHCAPQLIEIMEDSAKALGIAHNQMISYPAHDALILSRKMPMGMIFLRSQNGGVSHCPQEFTTKEDLCAGTQLLAQVLLKSAQKELF